MVSHQNTYFIPVGVSPARFARKTQTWLRVMSHDSVAVHTDPESQTTTEVELENLVRKARSSNLEEKLSAVQAIG